MHWLAQKRIYQLNLLLLWTQSLQSCIIPPLHGLSVANRWEESAERAEQGKEVRVGWLPKSRVVMSGFMAWETAAGGGWIDGWHIISLLIVAPQNWIASSLHSVGLWSVRIWLMSPTSFLSSDSFALSGPGLGLPSFSSDCYPSTPPSAAHSIPSLSWHHVSWRGNSRFGDQVYPNTSLVALYRLRL